MKLRLRYGKVEIEADGTPDEVRSFLPTFESLAVARVALERRIADATLDDMRRGPTVH